MTLAGRFCSAVSVNKAETWSLQVTGEFNCYSKRGDFIVSARLSGDTNQFESFFTRCTYTFYSAQSLKKRFYTLKF